MFLKHWFFYILILSFSYKTDASRQGSIRTVEEEYQISTNVRRNITLPCWPEKFPDKTASVYWEKMGTRSQGELVLLDGSLFISDLSKSDTKLYTCRMSENGHILTKVHLYVKGPPNSPINVTVSASARQAVVTWHQPMDPAWQAEMGGVPILGKVRYGLRHSSSWKHIEKNLTVTQNHVVVPHLSPNSTYEFQLWASNKYGDGRSVSAVALTLPDTSDLEMSFRVLRGSNEAMPRAWLTAAVVLLVAVNGLGTVVLLIYARRNGRVLRPKDEDSEQIELVPNIIENPTYNSNLGFGRTSDEGGATGFEEPHPNSALISHTEFV